MPSATSFPSLPTPYLTSRPVAYLALLLLPFAAAVGQQPVLVRDLNTQPLSNESSFPVAGVSLPTGVLLSADSLDGFGLPRGLELFRTLGLPNTTTLVKEILPGNLGSRPRQMVSLGGFAIFLADDPNGRGLWRSDGTAVGTTLLRSIVGDPSAGVVMAGKYYFLLGNDLWVSDGTIPGTQIVKTMTFAPFTAPSASMTLHAGAIYFAGSDTAAGRELWRSDGTTAGTVLVRDIEPGPAGSEVDNLITHGGAVYFTAATLTTGRELWTSDGTAAGTRIVHDVHPGAGHGILTVRPHDVIPVAIASTSKHLYFMAFEPTTGLELWRTDGTAASTVIVSDLLPGPADARPEKMIASGSSLIFAASIGPGAYSVYVTDGTTAGTVQLQQIGEIPRQFFHAGSQVFFSAFTSTSGRELFRTDGTAAGTRLVKDIHPGTASSDPSGFALAFGPTLVFGADDGVHGRELWISDGTATGTVLLEDIMLPASKNTASSSPGPIACTEDATFVAAREGNAKGLWRTDGSTNGTILLGAMDIGAGDHVQLMPAATRLFFDAGDAASGRELWASDGTIAGTGRVADILAGAGSSYPRDGVPLLGGSLFFTADDGIHGREPWISDGTAAGTRLVKDLRTAGPASSNPRLLTAMGNAVYFVAEEDAGLAFLRSDGSASGTVALLRFLTYGATAVAPVGNRLYLFVPAFPGSEVWVSDGTVAGTQRVYALPQFHHDASLAAVGDVLYVLVDNALWAVDPTTGGRLVRDLTINVTSQQRADNLVACGDRLFFGARAGSTTHPVLWQSDGTAAGTTPVLTTSNGFVFVGTSSLAANPALRAAGSRRIWFTGTDVQSGPFEPWVSDGSPAGTGMVHDVWPGSPSSSPSHLTHALGRLLFLAEDGIHGRELWSLDIGANARIAAPGCSAAGTPPHLAATDPVLGAPWQLRLTDAPALANAVLCLGLPAAGGGMVFPSGCRLTLDYTRPHVLLFFQTDAIGRWSLPATTVPNDATLNGLDLAAQAGVGAAATAPLGLDLSDTVRLVLGR